jgi:tRNA 2-thiouridine synthesizing protein A
MTGHDALEEAAYAAPAATLELLGTRDASASACAILTPAIRSRLGALEPGQILLVRTDDPAAPLDVAAWCSLTGHTVQATREEAGVFSFFIKKRGPAKEA